MKQFILYSFLLLSIFLNAQEEKKEVDKVLPKGNEAFQEKKYADAEADYRISQAKGISGAKASYNLGNAIYKQKSPSESKSSFLKVIENSTDKSEKHKAYHNLGNVFMNEKNYSGAVEAYKNALRNNPTDEKTRYNYALAKELLEKNPPKGGGGNDKNKDDQNKQKEKEKKEQQDKDKQKENKDKGNQKDKDPKEGEGNKGNEKDENQNQQPKPNPGGISKERIENILDAVNNEEKKVQDKMNLQKVKGKPVKTEKDW